MIINQRFRIGSSINPLTGSSQTVIDSTGIFAAILKTAIDVGAAVALVNNRMSGIKITKIFCLFGLSCTITKVSGVIEAKRIGI